LAQLAGRLMGAGRRRIWWMYANSRKDVGLVDIKTQDQEEEDGRLKSEGSEGRVLSTGYVEGDDRTEV
jgi:hypothetical protein